MAGAWARGTQLHWLESVVGHPLEAGDLSDVALEPGRRGLGHGADRVPAALAALDRAVRPVAEWWEDRRHDVLVTPAMRTPPWSLGTRPEGPLVDGFAVAFGFTGQPALVVPGAPTAGGLPVGVQLVARAGGDEGHGSPRARAYLRRRGVGALVPRRVDRGGRAPRFDRAAYRERNRVERGFGRLEQYRRVATRYEKRTANCLATLKLAAVLVWP